MNGANPEERTIKISVGKTLNMGDYQSLRVDISVEERSVEGELYSEWFDRLRDMAMGQLNDAVLKARKEFSSGR
jgi:hypothetical protein